MVDAVLINTEPVQEAETGSTADVEAASAAASAEAAAQAADLAIATAGTLAAESAQQAAETMATHSAEVEECRTRLTMLETSQALILERLETMQARQSPEPQVVAVAGAEVTPVSQEVREAEEPAPRPRRRLRLI